MKFTIHGCPTTDGEVLDLTCDYSLPECRKMIKLFKQQPWLVDVFYQNLLWYEANADDPTIAISPQTQATLRGLK